MKGLLRIEVYDPLGDDDLAILKTLSGLKRIEIASEKITDRGLADVCAVESLESVEIESTCKISGPGLEQLAMLPKFRTLVRVRDEFLRRYVPNKFTDEMLAHLPAPVLNYAN